MPRLGRQRGQTVVEFALLFPLFLFLILFLIEFGFVLFTHITVNNTAREAARFGAVLNLPGGCPSDGIVDTITERAEQASGNLIACEDVDVWYLDNDGDSIIERGDSVVVLISYEYNFVTPLAELGKLPLLNTILPDTITMRACSDARLENAFSNPPPGQVLAALDAVPADWPSITKDCA